MGNVQILILSLHEMQFITTEHWVPFRQETHRYDK